MRRGVVRPLRLPQLVWLAINDEGRIMGLAHRTLISARLAAYPGETIRQYKLVPAPTKGKAGRGRK